MRALLAVFLLLSSASAFGAQVRVKSSHESLTVAGAQSPGFKVAANDTLRGATIGPATVNVVLRRLAPPQSPPIPVKLMRDGREVARVLVGGEPVDRVEGAAEAASAPIEKVIEVPGGPHTLFVEVGAGAGHVLVSFDAPPAITPAPLVAKKPAARPRPAATPEELAAAKAASSAFEQASAKPAETKPSAGEAGSTTQPAAGNDGLALAALVPQKPAEAPADAKPVEAKPAEPAAKPADAVAAEPPQAAEVELARLAPAPEAPRAPRFLVGVRAGGANQLQLGASGFAAGLSARWAPNGRAAEPSGSGLLIGVAVDALHYGMAFDVGAGRGVPAYDHEVSVTTVPLLAEASWSLGGRFAPTFGFSLGAALTSVATATAFSESSDFGASFAAGVHAGVELPVGGDRVGVELRLLNATTGDAGEVRGLQVGGLLAQASWRFGL